MNLYKNLSNVYHEMYQILFDYKKEFNFYNTILSKFSSKEIIEYGCGTGNLAKMFLESGFGYLGVDLNQEMLDIARKKIPIDNFVLGDLKTFESDKIFDCALITGRTISYLRTNNDVIASFKCIARNVKDGGILIFDAIDAAIMFDDFDESEKEIIIGNYKRVSTSKPNLETGWTWDWNSEYYIKKEDEYEFIGNDHTVVRAFNKDEIELFLRMCDFDLLEVAKKEAYMWQDQYFVARKRKLLEY